MCKFFNFFTTIPTSVHHADDGTTKIDVYMEDETVWLTQAQLVELFQSSKSNISEHIKNIFTEGELDEVFSCQGILDNCFGWENQIRNR